MFTLNTLRTLANSTSYQRGQAYFRQGAVGKITQDGRTFAARVSGSERYRVTLDVAADGQPEFTCSCPYDYGGLCKHAVALGLAVLQEFDLHQLPAPPPTLAEAWARATEPQKLDFLFRLLHRDAATGRAFAAFVTQPAVEVGKKKKGAAAPSAELAQALAALEFDETLADEADEDEGEYYGYHDDANELFEAAEEQITAVLRPYAEALTSRLRAGEMAATLAEWAETGTALYRVKKPAVDTFDLFDGDYPLHLVRAWQVLLTEAGWLAVLGTAPPPKLERKAVEKWLTTELAAKKARWPDLPATWQPVLLALASTDEKLAAHLPPLLKKAAWLPDETRAAVRLQVARTTHDDTLWVSVAETQADTSFAVAGQLLNHYRNAPDAANHRRLAARALAAFPDQVHGYILEHFSIESAKELYRDALRYRCRATASLADYDALAELLSPAELRKFADEVSKLRDTTETHVRFAGELLHRQGRPDDLLAYLNRLDWLALPDAAPALLALVAPQRPDACVDTVAARLDAALTERPFAPTHTRPKRGGALYGQLAGWLAALYHQAGLREPVRMLVEFLFEQYASLALLKKAIREAQLVEEAPAHLPAEAADGALPRRRGRPPRPR
ncbi:MAG: SWIM zinc finger family protein [Hymenobacteraceae bacterium]|nr:SWIM zinc finger family protein [Hymenobacteraceae bacterium]